MDVTHILTKVKEKNSNSSLIKLNESVTGIPLVKPTEGEQFMFKMPNGKVRITSIVTRIFSSFKKYDVIHTLNSVYILEKIKK